MKEHYSEADLLETWYTAPGESMPVMMHLADCGECAARWERLDAKLRSLAACGHEKRGFWAAGRASIMKKIGRLLDRVRGNPDREGAGRRPRQP